MAKQQRICSNPACDKPATITGLCRPHYDAKRRQDNPEYFKRAFERRQKKLCTIDGCDKFTRYGKLCSAHYTRKLRHGDPLGGGTPLGEPLAWIEQHVGYDGDDCITWPYARNKGEEGVVTFRGRQISASRAMCIFAHGEPPDKDYDAAHSCGNGHLACMNQKHLRWATRKDNLADMEAHGTKMKGEKSPVAKLTEHDVREIRRMKGRFTLDELGATFGVSRATIHLIHQRKNWAWLPD